MCELQNMNLKLLRFKLVLGEVRESTHHKIVHGAITEDLK